MAKKTEPGGEITAAIIAGLFVLFVDKLLPLEKWGEHVPLLLRAFLVILMATAGFMGRRYYVILGGADERQGSEERENYDSLREAFLEGGTPAIVYNQWLTIALERVDEFFGDAGRNDKSWIARALFLETGGPRWTAAAFDKCLLLALFYPVVTVFAIWAMSGHVGVAERALFLPPDDPAEHYRVVTRMLTFLLVLFAIYALFRGARAKGLKSFLWGAVAFAVAGAVAVAKARADPVGPAVAFAFAFAVGGAVYLALNSVFNSGRALAGALAFSVAFGGALALAGASAGASAVAVGFAFAGAVVAFSGATAFTGASFVTYALAVAVSYALAGAGAGGLVGTFAGIFAFASLVAVQLTAGWARSKFHLGLFQSLMLTATCIVSYAAPYELAPLETWRRTGALLLFFVLLTLVNAPADWLALGFTRALLRRGLASGSWWPFLYALIDVIVAAFLIVGLAFGMVLAVQTFDDIAVLRAGPGARILPLGPLFEGLESAPGDYEYWWYGFCSFRR